MKLEISNGTIYFHINDRVFINTQNEWACEKRGMEIKTFKRLGDENYYYERCVPKE